MKNKINLNKKLLREQHVSKDAQRQIIHIHHKLDHIKYNPELYLNPVKEIENLEYKLQELWNFKIDKSFHTHKFQIKGCTCPTLDNSSMYGSGLFWVNGKCKWHGLRKPKTIWTLAAGFITVCQ